MDDTPGDGNPREEELKAAAEVVEHHRALARANPDALPDLASSLDSLCYRLSSLGRYEEALTAAAEAVELRWAHVQSFPPDSDLISRHMDECMYLTRWSVSTLEALLDHLGRLDAAPPAAAEPVERPHAPARHDSQASLLRVAGNLQHLARWISDAQIPDVAVTTAWRAVLFFLAAFQPGSAGRLGNLGALWNELGRNKEPQLAIPEAVELWRTLARHNPDVFHPGLADSFTLLVEWLYSDLLPLVEVVAELKRVLARRDPEAFLPGFASSLDSLSSALHWRGRPEEALTAAVERVEVRRALAQRDPEAFLPGLASSLHDLGNTLNGQERYEEALTAIAEAVSLYQPLAERDPKLQPDFAASLHSLGVALGERGRHEEAVAATHEAVNLYRQLVRFDPQWSDPTRFEPLLADSLELQWETLLELEWCEEALPAVMEAVELRRALARQNPERIPSHLAWSIGNLSVTLWRMERFEEALAYAHEAIDVLWPHLEHHPEYVEVMASLLSVPRQFYSALERPLPAELQERRAALERLQKQARVLVS